MARRVFLHLGLPKSGTSYLQAVFGHNKAQLRERADLLYPGDSWGDQVDAIRDLRRISVSPESQARVAGAWNRLAAEIRRWPGDAVVSMEWLCMAGPRQVARVGRSLGDAEVHLVFTVRDLGRTVPAAWQEFAQNRASWSWREFLEQVAGENAWDTPAGRLFWRQQDMELLLDRWSKLAPAERAHVITVPHDGRPDELWRRTAGVLGVDAGVCEVGELGANASLGMESAELVRRLNEKLAERHMPLAQYNRVVKRGLAKQILVQRRTSEHKVVLPPSYAEWAAERARQQVKAIESSGAHVVGSLEELRPRSEGVDAGRSEPSLEAVLEAGLDGLASLAITHAAALQEHKERLGVAETTIDQLRAEIQLRSSRPVRQALIDISERRPMVRRARVSYWRLVNAARRLSRSTP